MNQRNELNRRDFLRTASAVGLGTLLLPNEAWSSELARKFDIGATFILWGYGANNLEPALKDISTLGFHSFETFGHVIQEWEEKKGGIEPLIEKNGVPIKSAFCMTDVLDPSKRKDEVAKLIKWCQLTKKAGGTLIEYCPTSINRKGYNYKEHTKNLIESMNEYARVVTDQGLVCALHQHTDTAIETEEEVYFALENLDTRYMKFGPDVGQLEKGGADPVKIFKDFMPLIEHVHLKDFEGGDNGYLGYAPLGTGKVKIKKLLQLLEKNKTSMVGGIMFELDYDNKIKPAYETFEAAKISRDYLAKLGYEF
jgi:inosose dehydratase